MKDIMLRIMGSQISGLEGKSEESEGIELITEGRFARRGDAMYLFFEETELSGADGHTTSLKVADGKVRIKRYGNEGVEMAIEFEKGGKFKGLYDSPLGTIEMEVLTNDVDIRLDPEGAGSLGIDCSVSLKGLVESRNLLRFEIM